jgi:hypothetical protein
MATTYEKIATVTVGVGGASSIDFTSIPSTYTDIQLVLSGRYSAAATTGYCTAAFNGSTANFSIRGLYGSGSGTPGSFTTPSNFVGEIVGDSATASTFSSLSMYIPNYSGSNYKSYSVDSVGENNGTTAQATLTAGLWSVSTAINSISLSPNSGTLKQYSSATLYGIKNS